MTKKLCELEHVFFGPIVLWSISAKRLHFWESEEVNQIIFTDDYGCGYVTSYDEAFAAELKELGYSKVENPSEFKFETLKPINLR